MRLRDVSCGALAAAAAGVLLCATLLRATPQGDAPCTGSCAASYTCTPACSAIAPSTAQCTGYGFAISLLVTPVTGVCSNAGGQCTTRCRFDITVLYAAVGACLPLYLDGTECGNSINQIQLNQTCGFPPSCTAYTTTLYGNCNSLCTVSYTATNGPDVIQVGAWLTCAPSGTICR